MKGPGREWCLEFTLSRPSQVASPGSLGPSVTEGLGELGNLSSQEPSARKPPSAGEWDNGNTIICGQEVSKPLPPCRSFCSHTWC